jgi:hypothetical protein
MAICTPFILFVCEGVYCLFGEPEGLAKTRAERYDVYWKRTFSTVYLTARVLSHNLI